MSKSSTVAKKPRKPLTMEKAVNKLAVFLAPFSVADRKQVIKGANKIIKLASKFSNTQGGA